MAKFTHYLVTRFNIQIDGFGPELIQSGSRTSMWETERTKLFEKFCAPTVIGQSNKNFTWLIYHDVDTTEDITRRINNATKGIESIQLIPVSNFNEMLSHLRNLTGSSPTPFVITTRLDNDDGIGIHFIDAIQENFVSKDLTVLNLLGGVHYHVTKKILTAQRHYPNNSFTSLIEKTKQGEMITIMGFNHLHPTDQMTTINIKMKYAFWRTLHQENTAVRGNRGWPILPFAIHGHYNLDFAEIQLSIPMMLRYTFKWLPRAMIRKILYQSKNAFVKIKTGEK